MDGIFKEEKLNGLHKSVYSIWIKNECWGEWGNGYVLKILE